MGSQVCPISIGSCEPFLQRQANNDSDRAYYLLEWQQLLRASTTLANSVLQRLWYAGSSSYYKDEVTDEGSKGGDPIGIGIRALPIGFGIIFGAALILILILVVKGRTTPLMIVGCALMTAGKQISK
jgi:hypothetical protein